MALKMGRGWAKAVRVCGWSLPVIGLLFIGAEIRQSNATPRTPSTHLGPTMARGDVNWGFDTDQDGLPDEEELLFGGSPFLADTDGDGYDDGIEWALGSDLRDPLQIPDSKPTLRSYAFTTNGVIRFFIAVYPANIDLIGSFRCFIGSPRFTGAPEGDPSQGLGIFELTSVLPTIATAYTATEYLGLELVTFTFDLDQALLTNYGPLSVGFAAKIAGATCVDRLTLGVTGTTPYVFAVGTNAIPGASSSCVVQPLDPTGGGAEDPEYCKIGLDNGAPAGPGAIQYQVQTASCAPDGLLYCIDVDCSALAGQSMLLMDYGFLQSKAN